VKPATNVPTSDVAMSETDRRSEPKPVGTEHNTDVTAFHEDEEQTVVPTATVSERSAVPKFVPVSVIWVPPRHGPLMGAPKVATGASKVNFGVAVATKPDCHTTALGVPEPTGAEHVTAVVVVQVEVKHATLSSIAVTLESVRPRFTPNSVIDNLEVGA